LPIAESPPAPPRRAERSSASGAGAGAGAYVFYAYANNAFS